MSVLITICCRAGSKGLPGKHMRLFNSKPLIVWTIEQAQRCNYGPMMIVTDDMSIINHVVFLFRNGDKILVCDSEFTKDDSPKLNTLRYTLDQLADDSIDTIIDLDATNPCRAVADIKGALDLFRESNSDVVFSVTPAKKNPYFNQIVLYEDGSLSMFDEDEVFTRRQDAPPFADMNSSIYVYKTDWLKNPKNLHPVCQNSRAYVMPKESFCDIDTLIDFEVAEFLHKKYYM